MDHSSGSVRSLMAAVALVTGLSAFLIGSSMSLAGASPNPSTLFAGQTLSEGQGLASPNGTYVAQMQTDGNFVVYGPSGPLWADGVSNAYGPNRLVMQSDGNLVDYLWNNRPMWATGTSGPNGSFLVMQNDGNLVLYSASSQPLWATGTGRPTASVAPPRPATPPLVLAAEESSTFSLPRDGGISVLLPNLVDLWIFGDTPVETYGIANASPNPSTLFAGQTLSEGQGLASPNGTYVAQMQTDGNFVVYGPSGPLWADGVSNAYGPNRLVMQSDGNLVDYLWNNRPMWATGTSGPNGSFLVMQNDGNLVLYSASSQPLWATGTGRPTASVAPAWSLTGYVSSATAAEQTLIKNSTPTSLNEVGGPPNVPTQFIPTPNNVYLPDGSGRLCNPANGALYSARWPGGAVLLSDNRTLLVTYAEACVTPGTFSLEGWGFMEYDIVTNSIVQGPVDVFPPVSSGALDLVHSAIGSPVLDGAGNVDLFSTSCEALGQQTCASGGSIGVITIPATVAALSDPASYGPSHVTTLASPIGTSGWKALLLSVSPVKTAGSNYVMVEQEDKEGTYSVLTAAAPTGPWTSVAADQTLSDCTGLAGTLCYGLNPHPEIGTSQLYISYYDPSAGPVGQVGHVVMTVVPFSG